MRVGGVGRGLSFGVQPFSRFRLNYETFPHLHAQEERQEAMAVLAKNSRALFDEIENAAEVRLSIYVFDD